MSLRRVTPKTSKKCPCGGARVEAGASEHGNYVFFRCVSLRCGFTVACYKRAPKVEFIRGKQSHMEAR